MVWWYAKVVWENFDSSCPLSRCCEWCEILASPWMVEYIIYIYIIAILDLDLHRRFWFHLHAASHTNFRLSRRRCCGVCPLPRRGPPFLHSRTHRKSAGQGISQSHASTRPPPPRPLNTSDPGAPDADAAQRRLRDRASLGARRGAFPDVPASSFCLPGDRGGLASPLATSAGPASASTTSHPSPGLPPSTPTTDLPPLPPGLPPFAASTPPSCCLLHSYAAAAA